MGNLPSVIGPYRVIRQLGEGGMGTVFEAVHEVIQRRVAIKVLHAEAGRSADTINRFINEARAANLVGHPGLVQITDFGNLPDGAGYLVMEYMDGETLRSGSRIVAASCPHQRPCRLASRLRLPSAQPIKKVSSIATLLRLIVIVSEATENYHSDGQKIMTTHGANKSLTFPSRNSDGSMISMTKRKHAFGYVRVSTDMQAQLGLSLEAQQNQIAAYAKAYGYEMVGFYVDQDSAKNITGRPEYQKMIAEIDKGRADFIIATALDRFSRSQRDFLAFQDEYVKTDKVHLVIINQGINTELPASRQFLPLIVAFAQLERERTSERVKGIISYIRSQGGHFGKVPFGYATENDGRLKRLVKHPENYAWLEKMAEWYRAGVSFPDIAQRLNENGVKPTQRATWTKTSVYDLLVKEHIHIIRSEQGNKVYDRERAYNLAYQLKAEDRTFAFIADKLNAEGLRPGKAAQYHWWSVQDLLRSAVYHDRSTAIGCAKYWKSQGCSLRDIALKLQENGHLPKRGGQWFAQQVKQLLIS